MARRPYDCAAGYLGEIEPDEVAILKVIDAWYGYEKGHQRAISALTKSGL